MTVAADLATRHGALRRYFLRIDGVPYILNQRVADPSGDDSPLGENGVALPGFRGVEHPLDADCEACWRFDETSSTDDAVDATGNGHTGAVSGDYNAGHVPLGPTTGPFDGSRDVGDSVDTKHWFGVPDNASLQLDVLTLDAWVYVYDVNPASTFEGKIAAKLRGGELTTSESYVIGQRSTTPFPFRAAVTINDGPKTEYAAVSTATPTVGRHQVGMTYDGTWLRLYVDGALDTSVENTTGTPGLAHGAHPLRLGANYSGGYYYLEDVALYTTAKSADWFANVYASGVGGLNCLRVPSAEYAHDLDLKDMSIKPSSMTLELDDIDDPDNAGESFFGKLFAPGRWDSADAERTTTCRVSLASTQFDADTNTIHCKNTASFNSFPSSGLAYIGSATVTYSGKGTAATINTGGYLDATLGTLTGCVIGEYSAITAPRGGGTTAMGVTIKHPVAEDWTATDLGRGHVVSTVPYAWLGKRVAMYVTTWDEATHAWNSIDDAQLVWAGRLGDAIQYDPKRRVWRLSCEHIAADLDRPIMASAPTARLCGVNLNSLGDWGRAWYVVELYQGAPVSQVRCTVASGFYDIAGLAEAMTDAMNDWSAWSGNAHATSFVCQLHLNDGEWEFAIRSEAVDHSWFVIPDGSPFSEFAQRNYAHCWQVFGFDISKTINVDGGSGGDGNARGGKGYEHYHPLDLRYNGGTMMVLENGTDYLWSSQGDYGSDLAYVESKKAKLDGETTGAYVTAYTARTTAQSVNYKPASSSVVISNTTKLTLANGITQPPAGDRTAKGFLGGEDRLDYPEIKNVYMPIWRDSSARLRGPFEALLYPLLSTGTTDYNGATYDKLPPEASIGMPVSLVDTASFLDADREILSCYPSLALRRFYPISKATSWRELFSREAKLFGYALTWKASQWTVVNVMHPERQFIDVTLDDGNTAYPSDWPVIDMSMDTTINRWEFKLDYDYATDKYRTTVSIRDEEADTATTSVRARQLEHPGVLPQKSDYATRSLVQIKIQDEMFIMRRPWQVVRRTLSPDLLGLLAVGDVVNYHVDTATHPDPMGSGAMTCDAVAMILGLRWNFATGIGACTLMVYGQDETRVLPWGPSCAVDFGATNGGWDAANGILTVLEDEFTTAGTEPNDPTLFAAGDKILIMERAPADPSSLTLTPAVLTVVSYAPLTRKLTVEETTITGYDTTGESEYVLNFADYASVVAAQLTRGTWQAAPATHLLNAADRAKAYG